ncbi:class I SAM-dependent methyltransferase [Shewanella sp. 1CM18E]|uniref:class I SAM-dependent DNA methyltransferase n=1 Tax=Shewanella sp. 1CM18E TaxID=2929169 RepID=UPI0020BE6D42|nr:class I SAM-dependent methyltransferase [Shewanella sp. 1CM18E]MCK8044477.1 class I SAM-dependent methyltransferase [Shewanella sp. 1CM18E]
MCANIDYLTQSECIRRHHQLFGNGDKRHLDLACGTGPHVRHFINNGYQSQGLDINQPMLDIAKLHCPEAEFSLQDMCDFKVDEKLDLITCFLYSIHYSDGIEKLKQCIASAHQALNTGGVFCFNVVEKSMIVNNSFAQYQLEHENSQFTFSSGWDYCGEGERQSLKVSIEKTTDLISQSWQDEHPMVAVSFAELKQLLAPYFEVHMFEHDYEKILTWNGHSGNAIFTCVKI